MRANFVPVSAAFDETPTVDSSEKCALASRLGVFVETVNMLRRNERQSERSVTNSRNRLVHHSTEITTDSDSGAMRLRYLSRLTKWR
jgi:hypothetical protein